MSSENQSLGDPSMVGLFRMEVETHVATLNAGLLSLEKNPAETKGLEALMRAAHSVKGAARIVNIEMAIGLAHAMEDVFVAVQGGTLALNSGTIDTLLSATDTLARIGRLASDETIKELMALSEEAASRADALTAIKEGRVAGPVVSEEKAAPAPEKKSEPEAPVGKEVHQEAVRVSAQHLDNLMNLAAESMVRGRRLTQFSDSLRLLRKELAAVHTSLRDLHHVMVRIGSTIHAAREKTNRGPAGDRGTDVNGREEGIGHLVKAPRLLRNPAPDVCLVGTTVIGGVLGCLKVEARRFCEPDMTLGARALVVFTNEVAIGGWPVPEGSTAAHGPVDPTVPHDHR